MCGLVAMVSMRGAAIATNQLKNMCDIIAHRGPDDAGYLVGQTGRFSASRVMHELEFNDAQFHPITPMIPAIDTPHGMNALKRHNWDVFLGHRRLAILDTSAAGHQPMSDLSRNIWVSYNGEIYNFKSIRTTLETLGYQFITNTDTEVLIYAYHHWGADCVHQFNGMFAFVIWDKYQNKIFIGRDRYGIKPLYYTQLADGTFIFASEIKSILQAQSYQSGLDLEGVYEYFTFQNSLQAIMHESI
jgi:asparagine synthase (glutamine-hydrolysing)